MSSLHPLEQKAAYRNIITTQCLGAIALQIVSGSVLLLYMNALGFSGSRIMAYLSMSGVINGCLQVPLSFVADRWGKKRMGLTGMCINSTGFLGIASSGWLHGGGAEVLFAFGLGFYTLGTVFMSSGWFALLSPIVPTEERGRFFGKLRFSWQVVAVLFLAFCGFFLTGDSPLWRFQALFYVVVVMLIVRMGFYRRIPELDGVSKDQFHPWQSLLEVMRAPGYTSFCCYVFLLSLFTTGVPAMFALVQKSVLVWGDDTIVLVGNFIMVGAAIGYYFGGKMVDRFGTKFPFLVCHLGYALGMLLFFARNFVPLNPFFLISGVSLAYGFFTAVSSIAVSSEMLALIPEKNKSLSTSFCTTMTKMGTSISMLIPAWSLKLGFLKEKWNLFGESMSQYDSLILVYALMVFLLVVTLGLIPSVLAKAACFPKVGD